MLKDIFGKFFERFACTQCRDKLKLTTIGDVPVASTHAVDALAEGLVGSGDCSGA